MTYGSEMNFKSSGGHSSSLPAHDMSIQKLRYLWDFELKLHITECPFILSTPRQTCTIYMRFHHHLMCHMWGGWIFGTFKRSTMWCSCSWFVCYHNTVQTRRHRLLPRLSNSNFSSLYFINWSASLGVLVIFCHVLSSVSVKVESIVPLPKALIICQNLSTRQTNRQTKSGWKHSLLINSPRVKQEVVEASWDQDFFFFFGNSTCLFCSSSECDHCVHIGSNKIIFK